MGLHFFLVLFSSSCLSTKVTINASFIKIRNRALENPDAKNIEVGIINPLKVNMMKSSFVNAETEFTEESVLEKSMNGGGLQETFGNTSIDIDKIEVDSNYTAPKIEGGKVTVKFMEDLITAYKERKKLHEKYVYIILREAKKYLQKQPSLVEIKIPDDQNITVVGDIHGQLYDLLHIFELNKFPSESNRYLFNGDFVDHGNYSMECVMILLGFKLLYPNAVFLNRGNHETQPSTEFGFGVDCCHLYSEKMIDAFQEVFQWLPVAHLINKKVLVLHGGLFSRRNVTLEDIKNMKRNDEPEEPKNWRESFDKGDENSMLVDILWADPNGTEGRAPNKRRWCSIFFGPDVTKAFCTRNKLDYIIRSHTPEKAGYKVEHDGQLITVFSASRYYKDNLGAIIQLRAPDLEPGFVTWKKAPDPHYQRQKEKNQGGYTEKKVWFS